MKQVAGQITIWDFLDELKAVEIPQMHLVKGQTVFYVDKCNISMYEVYGTYDIEDEPEPMLVLIARKGADTPFKCIPISNVGETVFETEEMAKDVALENLDKCQCILSSEMKIEEFKSYIGKKNDGTLLTAFYAVLKNGYVYMKDYYSCGHLIKATKEEAEKILKEQLDNYTIRARETSDVPKLKNLYKCHGKNTDWLYAEAQCPMVG